MTLTSRKSDTPEVFLSTQPYVSACLCRKTPTAAPVLEGKDILVTLLMLTGAPERPSLEAARQMATAQAQQLAQPATGMASGGIAALAKGRYLAGPTDGMEDRINTTIDGKQPAKLSHGEFVVPADVVSHLGNGNSEAGAKQLYAMMDRIRQARTGTKKQGKQVKAQKYLPA